jgi:hypothetical protein
MDALGDLAHSQPLVGQADDESLVLPQKAGVMSLGTMGRAEFDALGPPLVDR